MKTVHIHRFGLLLFNIVLQGCSGLSMESQANRFFSDPQQSRMAHAIEEGNTKTIVNLIRNGTVSADGFGTTQKEQAISFLTYAVMVKNKRAIGALIESGARVNFKTPDQWSALAEAARSPDESLLPLLLDAGGNPRIRGPRDEPLTFIAFSNERYRSLALLLDRGTEVNAQDATGDTLLAFMAKVNAYEQMLLLLDRGADPGISRGENHVSVAWTVQKQAGRLVPAAEKLRQQVVEALEARGVQFPVSPPPTWDPAHGKYTSAPH